MMKGIRRAWMVAMSSRVLGGIVALGLALEEVLDETDGAELASGTTLAFDAGLAEAANTHVQRHNVDARYPRLRARTIVRTRAEWAQGIWQGCSPSDRLYEPQRPGASAARRRSRSKTEDRILGAATDAEQCKQGFAVVSPNRSKTATLA